MAQNGNYGTFNRQGSGPACRTGALWRLLGSNQRRLSRQIYSLLPLATRANRLDAALIPWCSDRAPDEITRALRSPTNGHAQGVSARVGYDRWPRSQTFAAAPPAPLTSLQRFHPSYRYARHHEEKTE